MSSTFFIFFKIIFGVSYKSNFTEQNACEPRAARFGNGGPGPALRPAGLLPARPYAFVPGSKFFTQLPAGKCCFTGDQSGLFAPRSPLTLVASFRGAKSSHNFRPESAISPATGPASLLPTPRKSLCLRFGEQNLHITPGRKVQFRRRPVQSLCSPLPANPCRFVSGSKIFTQRSAEKCSFAGDRAALFAPRSPLTLVASFRGAKSSHNFRPESIVSPATGPPSLLPAPRYPLSLRFGEQNLHTTSGRKVQFRRRFFVSWVEKKQYATFLSTSHTAFL